MSERKPNCKILEEEFLETMAAISFDDESDAYGVRMDRFKKNIVVTITEEGADTYCHPETGNTLGSLLDGILQNCKGRLITSISKMNDGSYIVIQPIPDN